jgi:hypothetical protein
MSSVHGRRALDFFVTGHVYTHEPAGVVRERRNPRPDVPVEGFVNGWLPDSGTTLTWVVPEIR